MRKRGLFSRQRAPQSGRGNISPGQPTAFSPSLNLAPSTEHQRERGARVGIWGIDGGTGRGFGPLPCPCQGVFQPPVNERIFVRSGSSFPTGGAVGPSAADCEALLSLEDRAPLLMPLPGPRFGNSPVYNYKYIIWFIFPNLLFCRCL